MSSEINVEGWLEVEHLETVGWKLPFCRRHSLLKVWNGTMGWGTEDKSVLLKQTLSKAENILQWHLMIFQTYINILHFADVESECYITWLWYKNLLGIDLRRKIYPKRIRLDPFDGESKGNRSHCLISNMHIFSGWKSSFFSSSFPESTHTSKLSEINQDFLLLCQIWESVDHTKKSKGSPWNRAMQKVVFVLLSKLSVKEEVNYTKDWILLFMDPTLEMETA